MKNFTDSIKPISDKIFLILTFAVVFVIPFGMYITKIVLIFWIFSGLIQFRLSDFTANLKPHKLKTITFLLLLVFFLFHIFGYFYSDDKSTALQEIWKFIYILLFLPILISASNLLNKNYKTILLFFILGNFFASISCLFVAFYNSINIVDNSLIFKSSVIEEYSFLESLRYSTNYFFYTYFSIFLHTSYFAFYIIFSIIILLFISKDNNLGEENYLTKLFSKKAVTFILFLFFIGIVFLLSSKANILALFIIFFSVFLLSKIKYKYVYIIVLIIVSAIFVTNNPRFNVFFKNLKTEKSTDSLQVKSQNERLYIWKSAIDISIENLFFGVGTGDSKQELLKKNKLNNGELLVNSKLNAHNVFLEVLIRFGLFGFIPFISIFCIGIYLAIRDRNKILMLFLLLAGVNFLFESMLNRIAGIIFWSFFIILLLLKNNKSKIIIA